MDFLKNLKKINPLQLFVDLYNEQIEEKEDSQIEGFRNIETKKIIVFGPIAWFLSLIVSIYAVYLSQIRNKNESTGTRVLYGILAYLFSVIYILYYFISKK